MNMAAKLAIVTLIVQMCLNLSVSGLVGEFCALADGNQGVCKPDRECPGILQKILNRQLRPTICGFEWFTVIICCPKTEETVTTTTRTTIVNPTTQLPLATTKKYPLSEPPIIKTGERCVLRDGTQGICQQNYDYDEFFNYIRKKSSRPVVCNEMEGIVFCRPLNKDDASVRTQNNDRISLRKCKEYYPSYFEQKPQGVQFAYGGVEVLAGKYPHMAALGWIYPDGSGYAWNCGASLISKNFVLTAAHCAAVPDTGTFTKLEPSVVRLGEITVKSEKSESDIEIDSIIIHPQYAPPLRYNDIALMRLAKPVSISSLIKPICLSQSYARVLHSTASGWGKTSSFGPQSVNLLEVSLQIVNNKMCDLQYKNNSRRLPRGIIEGQICAGHPRGEQDTCQGDSGGPLQINDPELFFAQSLIGVTSFGIGCGKVTIPGVYTRVSYYLDWIESIVWQ